MITAKIVPESPLEGVVRVNIGNNVLYYNKKDDLIDRFVLYNRMPEFINFPLFGLLQFSIKDESEQCHGAWLRHWLHVTWIILFIHKLQ